MEKMRNRCHITRNLVRTRICYHSILTKNFQIRPFDLHNAAAAAKSHQSCPTLCNPIDGSPPGSAVPGILQARTLEWVAISFSNAWMWKMKVKLLSYAWLFVTPWIVAHQAPLSMRFSRQEYWSGLPFPSPKGVEIILKSRGFTKQENREVSSYYGKNALVNG